MTEFSSISLPLRQIIFDFIGLEDRMINILNSESDSFCNRTNFCILEYYYEILSILEIKPKNKSLISESLRSLCHHKNLKGIRLMMKCVSLDELDFGSATKIQFEHILEERIPPSLFFLFVSDRILFAIKATGLTAETFMKKYIEKMMKPGECKILTQYFTAKLKY